LQNLFFHQLTDCYIKKGDIKNKIINLIWDNIEMLLDFIGSPKPTIGVEIELQIIDPETLDLIPKAELLLHACELQGLERVKTEIHQSMIEIDSESSKDVKECKAFLSLRIQQLNQIANELGLKLGVSGTHPFQRWNDRLISNHERYQSIHQKYRWIAKRINVYGLHVHIGVKCGEDALAISNALIRYLPHLLALSANSPFWQGVDTGMQSSRINIMQSFPFAGIPMSFKNWSDFQYYCSTLYRSGAISSLKDLYWFIRPNEQFGTIEFRICDALSNLDETMALVALIQSLVVFVEENLDDEAWKWTKEQQWMIPENLWTAARDGLDGTILEPNGKTHIISDLVLQLVEQLTPTALKLNCLDELLYIHNIINYGNGAKRQLTLFDKTRSLKDIVNLSISDFDLTAPLVIT
jgi:carboxylate-amine ligase